LPSKNILYIQNGFCAGNDRKYCDWFALGSPNTMQKYCNIYNYIYKYYKNGVIHMHKFIENVVNDIQVNTIEYEFHVTIKHIFYKYRK
jgi:hypothetical protein